MTCPGCLRGCRGSAFVVFFLSGEMEIDASDGHATPHGASISVTISFVVPLNIAALPSASTM
jgi:hypothetical protein